VKNISWIAATISQLDGFLSLITFSSIKLPATIMELHTIPISNIGFEFMKRFISSSL